MAWWVTAAPPAMEEERAGKRPQTKGEYGPWGGFVTCCHPAWPGVACQQVQSTDCEGSPASPPSHGPGENIKRRALKETRATAKEAQVEPWVGGPCWRVAGRKDDSDQRGRLGPVELGVGASEPYRDPGHGWVARC